jgi:excisionase family DNA binding protein
MAAIAPNAPKLFTTRQTAELCGVAPKTIREWVAAGVLPAVRVGDFGHLRISSEAIEELLERAKGDAA